VDLMFLCENPSDKLFEPILNVYYIQGFRWFGVMGQVAMYLVADQNSKKRARVALLNKRMRRVQRDVLV